MPETKYRLVCFSSATNAGIVAERVFDSPGLRLPGIMQAAKRLVDALIGANCAKLDQPALATQAAFRRGSRILFIMIALKRPSRFPAYRVLACAAILGGAAFLACATAHAQAAPTGPLTPPPEHNVHRVGTEPTPAAPPALPPEEIIKRFAQKEDEYLTARAGYGYKKTVRLEEFADDGKQSGQLLLVTEAIAGADGKLREKTVEKPESTLQFLEMGPEDFQQLARMPAYALVTANLAKYDLKYLGKELVDEVECYIFQVKPRAVERAHYFFDGIVWVDAQYLEVVKTYGKWVNDLGDMHSGTMPFSIFETYRDNVDGKYWMPNYARSDATLRLKDRYVNVRLVIKWADYKPLSATAPSAAPASTATPAQPAPAPTPSSTPTPTRR